MFDGIMPNERKQPKKEPSAAFLANIADVAMSCKLEFEMDPDPELREKFFAAYKAVVDLVYTIAYDGDQEMVRKSEEHGVIPRIKGPFDENDPSITWMP